MALEPHFGHVWSRFWRILGFFFWLHASLHYGNGMIMIELKSTQQESYVFSLLNVLHMFIDITITLVKHTLKCYCYCS